MNKYRTTIREDGVIVEYSLPDGRGWRRSDVFSGVITVEKLEKIIESHLKENGPPEPLIRYSQDWWIKIADGSCWIYLQQEDARGGRAYYAEPSEIPDTIVADILRTIAEDIDLDFVDLVGDDVEDEVEDDVAYLHAGDKAELIANLLRDKFRDLYEALAALR